MMRPLPPAILFDMDDTILAVSGSARVVWTRIAEEFAAALAPLSPAEIVTAIEIQSQRLWILHGIANGECVWQRRGAMSLRAPLPCSVRPKRRSQRRSLAT